MSVKKIVERSPFDKNTADSLSRRYYGRKYSRAGAQLLKCTMRSGVDTALRLSDGSFLDLTFPNSRQLSIRSEGLPVIIRHVSEDGREILKVSFNDSMKPIVMTALIKTLPTLKNLIEVSRQSNQISRE